MWETQAGKFNTSKKVNVYFCLPEFSSTKIVTWKCHIDESTKGRYDMILGRDLLTALVLVLDIIFSETSYMAEKYLTKDVHHLWLT